jgi:hypothetical protein
VVQSRFGESKEDLLDRFQLGVEISLARENYLTTSSLEIFQGFVLWLTCITKEEDMGMTAIKIQVTCLLTDFIRQGMGAARHCNADRAQPRLTS